MRKRLVLALAACASVLRPRSPGARSGTSSSRDARSTPAARAQAVFRAEPQGSIVCVNDPDIWRNMGWPDDPNHFLDFGSQEYGDSPFTALPRDQGAAIQKFGAVDGAIGRALPWRIEEISASFVAPSKASAVSRRTRSAMRSCSRRWRALPAGCASAVSRDRRLRRAEDRQARHPCALRAGSHRASDRNCTSCRRRSNP